MTTQGSWWGEQPTGYRDEFLDSLESDPRYIYYANVGQQGGGRNRQRRLRGMFSDVQNQFMGALGQQVLSGQAPTLRFRDWIRDFENRGGFRDMDRDFRIRGRQMSGMPRTRFLLRHY